MGEDYSILLDRISNFDMDLNSYYKINRNLNNFKNYSITIAHPLEIINDFSYLDVKTLFTNNIIIELNRIINKTSLIKVFDTDDFDYIDIRNTNENIRAQSSISSREIINNILYIGKEYKNLVSYGLVLNLLQDSSQFIVYPFSSRVSSGIYKYGKIGHIDVWIDPYMKYDDTKISYFNDIDINFCDPVISHINEATFRPMTNLKFKLDINTSNTKKLFIIDNESSDTFREYQSLQRDIKIDRILDEEE